MCVCERSLFLYVLHNSPVLYEDQTDRWASERSSRSSRLPQKRTRSLAHTLSMRDISSNNTVCFSLSPPLSRVYRQMRGNVPDCNLFHEANEMRVPHSTTDLSHRCPPSHTGWQTHTLAPHAHTHTHTYTPNHTHTVYLLLHRRPQTHTNKRHTSARSRSPSSTFSTFST